MLNDPDAPVQGNPAGDVMVVEYFDDQCPFCKANHSLLMEELARDRGIRLILKDWPIFGPASLHATRLVLGAQRQGDHAATQAALMATRGRLTEAQIERRLTEAGIIAAAATSGRTGSVGRPAGPQRGAGAGLRLHRHPRPTSSA